MKRTRRWILSSANGAPDAAKFSDDVCGLPCIARLLQRKGLLNDQQVGDFLRPRLRPLRGPFFVPDLRAAVGAARWRKLSDRCVLPSMRAAVDRILCAIIDRQRIALYGDYDVDGVTS